MSSNWEAYYDLLPAGDSESGVMGGGMENQGLEDMVSHIPGASTPTEMFRGRFVHYFNLPQSYFRLPHLISLVFSSLS